MPEPDSKEPLMIYSKNGTVITVRSPIRNRILYLLAEEGPVSFSRIMEYTGLSKSTVSGYVSSLELKELISMVPDRRDARKKTYVLTASLIGNITPSIQNGTSDFRELIRQAYAKYDKIDYKEILPHIIKVALSESGINIDPVIRRGGEILGQAVAVYLVANTLDKTLANIAEFWKHYGFGEVKIRSMDPLQIEVYHCYECMIMPKDSGKNCAISCGMLKAIFTAYYNEKVNVEEIQCMTEGYDCCCVEISRPEQG
ncbi:MAG: V4R domain-containing protein [Methanocorpusculum sp.]|jgi:hypothetical protein|uniref:MarR family transcriptional regulator n=1 Tax=Methanocorpusculum sp. TaxID=2058474 RepID=UPI002727B821|nr:V4R domain-containing protein [Methanocorpusculum sp.]MDO9523420.1 V4R domain-containing protein [Methanocorpusculum sp.]